MSITLKKPDITELKPRITVFGVGGGEARGLQQHGMAARWVYGMELIPP